MKLENNWKYKTLESLEKEVWTHNNFGSHLVQRTQALRKIPLSQFKTEDIRIMIGQEIGLDHLIPLALETLAKDLWAEGNFYEGDLLKNVLAVPTKFWDNNKNYWVMLNGLIKGDRDKIAKERFDTSNFDNWKHKTSK